MANNDDNDNRLITGMIAHRKPVSDINIGNIYFGRCMSFSGNTYDIRTALVKSEARPKLFSDEEFAPLRVTYTC